MFRMRFRGSGGSGQDADRGKGSVALVEIETIADDKFIPNGKTHPTGFYRAEPFSFLVEENTDGHAPGPQFFGVGPGSMQGEAGIKNIINEEDIPSAEISPAMMKAADFPRRAGALIA